MMLTFEIGREGYGNSEPDLASLTREYYINAYRDGRRETIADELTAAEAVELNSVLWKYAERLLLVQHV